MVTCLLLLTHIQTFRKLLDQLIRLITHPELIIQLRKFTSHDFNEYCVYIRIIIEHLIAFVHTQNGLAGSLKASQVDSKTIHYS